MMAWVRAVGWRLAESPVFWVIVFAELVVVARLVFGGPAD